MKYLRLIPLFLLVSLTVSAQEPEETEDWSRRPEVITPGKKNQAPSDATLLYAGKADAGRWQHGEGDSIKWKTGKSLTVVASTGAIRTRESFGDIQLHIEWRAPKKVKGEGQGRGNSGIYLMGLYEVQVLDSYNNETYYNGQAGSIYKQHIPQVNASLPPGKWQTYDIVFTAPRFSEDHSLLSPAYVSVIHNGVLIQNHVELAGPTEFIGKPSYRVHEDKMPLMLQDHGNPVSYRNIWIREVSSSENNRITKENQNEKSSNTIHRTMGRSPF